MPTTPPNAAETGQHVTLIALLLSLALAATKILGGVLGRSQALLADGVESIADIFSTLTVWGGLRLANRPPDDNHPFGHGKAESLAGMVVGMFMLSAAALITVASVHDMRAPAELPAPWTLWVLVGVMLIKEAMCRWMQRVGRTIHSTALQNEGAHHRADAITSLAAFAGISATLLGGPAWAAADSWAALFAAGLIAVNALSLLRRSLAEVMDESVSDDIVHELRAIAVAHGAVLAVDQCRIRKSGLGLWMDIHILVDGNLTVREGHAIGHAVEAALLQCDNHPIHDVVVHVEPEDAHPELLFDL